jgi:5-methylcytosine-specific restriction endonuclease McrA
MSSGLGPYKAKFRAYLFEKQKGLCYYCDKEMTLNRKKNGQPTKTFATLEHLIRREQGGKVNSTNIVLAHYRCNLKANREWQRK